jgi:hypothetical protein
LNHFSKLHDQRWCRTDWYVQERRLCNGAELGENKYESAGD